MVEQETESVKTNQEERSRELIRHQYQESYRPSEWDFPNLKEGSLQHSEYSVQYNAPTTYN